MHLDYFFSLLVPFVSFSLLAGNVTVTRKANDFDLNPVTSNTRINDIITAVWFGPILKLNGKAFKSCI